MKTKDWIKNFERNVPEGFPIVVMGWPDAEYGIYHKNYIDYCSDTVNDTPYGESVPLLPTFEEWKQKERSRSPDDLGFSIDCCDTCGALPGIRHAATAMPSDHADKDYVPLSVCEDCVQYTTNGETPVNCED
ncbi:MAG: hypothetical protein IPH82_20850 [Chloroflexi bacterium]|nr:hypothetical protein [Chloroflexota bacterium]